MKFQIIRVLIFLLLTIGVVSAAEYTVCSSGDCTYTTDGTDDQTEINQAIEDCAADVDCDTVNLTDSHYNIASSGSYKYWDYDRWRTDDFSIVIDNVDDITLKGLGKRQTVLSVTDSCGGTEAAIFVNGTYENQVQNITLKDFEIDTNLYSHECWVGGSSVYAKAPVGVFSAFVDNYNLTSLYVHAGGVALHGADVDNVIIKNCTARGELGVSIQGKGGDLGWYSTDGLIEGCDITGASGTGSSGFPVRLEGNCYRWTFENNYIHDHNTFSPGYSGNKYIYLYNNTIENVNKVEFYKTDNVEVKWNDISDTDTVGIQINVKGGTESNYVIEGNRIWGVLYDQWNFHGTGILMTTRDVDGTLNDVDIVGNTIYNCRRGIGAESTSGEVLSGDNIDIYNNIISDCTESGLWIEDSEVEMEWNNAYNNIYSCNHPYDGGGLSKGTGEIHEDPLFADPSNHDFHLKSTVGRYYEGSWVTDAVNSPCIDAGTGSYSNEPDYPNGSRNMGAYGNTIYASKGGDVFPPASIIDLTNSTYNQTFINWTWTNPPDTDFNHTMVYINGVFEINTSKAYYNDTGLTNGTNYTISTLTVDTSGNVNSTWINATSTTKSPKSIMDLLRKPHVVGLGLVTALAACLYTIKRRRKG